MTQQSFRQKSLAILTGLFFISLTGAGIQASRFLWDEGSVRPIVPNMMPMAVQHFTFGMKEQFADALWLRSIQDFDYCETYAKPKICTDEGWLYHMLDLISDLSPSFRMPLATGPLALSVIISDIKGASLLFDKAVRLFPGDWPITSRAAYHALYEENDKAKAAKLLQMAGSTGGPSWYFMLATKLYSQSGQIEVAEAMYHQVANDPHSDPRLVKAMADRLEKLKKSAAH